MKADPARKEQTVTKLKGTGTVQMVKNKDRIERKRGKRSDCDRGAFQGKVHLRWGKCISKRELYKRPDACNPRLGAT